MDAPLCILYPDPIHFHLLFSMVVVVKAYWLWVWHKDGSSGPVVVLAFARVAVLIVLEGL